MLDNLRFGVFKYGDLGLFKSPLRIFRHCMELLRHCFRLLIDSVTLLQSLFDLLNALRQPALETVAVIADQIDAALHRMLQGISSLIQLCNDGVIRCIRREIGADLPLHRADLAAHCVEAFGQQLELRRLHVGKCIGCVIQLFDHVRGIPLDFAVQRVELLIHFGQEIRKGICCFAHEKDLLFI